jgi:CubicO group peptidase (beta-lactamase class C family)
MSRSPDLTSALTELITKDRVPGAQVAVLGDDRVVDAAAGVLNTRTGVAATRDSVFHIGSITKAVTATLVMQLVDDGLVDLDAPVRRCLPEFRVGDRAATEAITIRQLLCHTSGIEGDLFTDTGRDRDAIEKFVATLEGAGQVHRPGELWSYCSTGYILLGRIVEVLRGKRFDAVVRERLAAPLGMTRLATDADEAILFRAAVGHIETDPGAGERPTPVWAPPASNAPSAGLSMSARDLLGFARMHLAGGRAADGTRILGASAARAMVDPQVPMPDIGYGSDWGLGWQLFDQHAGRLFGHDGRICG